MKNSDRVVRHRGEKSYSEKGLETGTALAETSPARTPKGITKKMTP